ncbi:glycosyl hydrolase family 76-domain-containing protein [Xylariales sp. PMI_506]|nr:glycosyl hydrolase family 76-domain-containing protein [Xylariales sp. PMI_506]
MRSLTTHAASCLSLLALTANALSLDVSSTDSIKSAAASVAYGLVSQYDGNQTGNPIGVYGSPYYWWSSGAVWESLVDYWSLTGDDAYNSLVAQALFAQIGENDDYMPANQSASEGNDDQSIWALAALTAAERNFTVTSTAGPTWLELATAAFDDQANRWDSATCGGGLRWQIYTFNSGYNYKNSLANANFFQLAARLAQLTGNQTFSDWAEKSYDWLMLSGFVDPEGAVFDGASTTSNCSSISKLQFSMNAGVFLYGTAVMYNLTGDSSWSTPLTAVLNQTTSIFFNDGIAEEVACESEGTCSLDMHFYKGALMRDLARTARAAPFTADTILPLLQSSAKAVAATACTNSNGSCSFDWQGTDDGDAIYDLGTQYSALEAIQANLQPISGLVAANATSTSDGGSSSTTSGQGSSSTTAKNAGVSLSSTVGLGVTAVLLASQILFL